MLGADGGERHTGIVDGGEMCRYRLHVKEKNESFLFFFYVLADMIRVGLANVIVKKIAPTLCFFEA